MPGKTAKVTITERQQDILRSISHAPTASRSSANERPSSSWPSRSGATARSPWKSGCRGGRSAPGDDAGPRPGTPHPDRVQRDPRRLAPGHRAVLRDEPRPGPPASSPPSRSSRSWRSPASRRRSRAARSLTGRPASWPMRSSSGASCSRSRPRRWGVTSARPPCSPTRSGTGSTPPRRTRGRFASRSRRSATPTWRRPALADHGTHTVSTDEMTGIQALERNAPGQPMT